MSDSIEEKDAIIFVENVNKHNIKNDSNFLLENINLLGRKNVLDVGYGTGNLLFKMKNKNSRLELYGLEKSKVLYKYSYKEMLEKDINIFCIDFIEWEIEEKFDIIIMSFYLHHVDFEKHLEKAIYFLKSNGKIVILDRIAEDEKSKKEFTRYWEEYYSDKHEWDEECPRIFTKKELIYMLEKKNYEVDKFMLVPNDFRKGSENFPKTVAIINKKDI